MMWIICILVPALFMFAVRGRRMIPNRLQSLVEISVEFLKNMVVENMGKEGLRFFPFHCYVILFYPILQSSWDYSWFLYSNQPDYCYCTLCNNSVHNKSNRRLNETQNQIL